MTKEMVDRKVGVFISSKCDSKEEIDKGIIKYSVMRKALALLLEETNMCNVFAFEEAPGTSRSVIDSYMEPLEDSDLVIIIVDNKDDISSATMKEINRARALNKKCIYVFCDERERNKTELQCQIESDTTNPKYVVAHEFSDIAREAYRAVLNDVIYTYISYCKGRIAYESHYEKENTGVNVDIGDVMIPKKYLKEFPYTKYIVKKEAGINLEKIDPVDKIDCNCASMIGLVIGSSLVEKPDYKRIETDIKRLHKGNVQKLILMRYKAVRSYFNGDLESCIENLNECLQFCNEYKKIPKWLINDLAIDLRNVQVEIDRENDIINYDSSGQQILDQDSEPLYYPVIDRIVADYNDEIIMHQFNNLTQSPYTVDLGDADNIMERICNTFVIAYCYGSITHMVIYRKRLYKYLMGVVLEIRSHRMFMLTIKLLLMSNDEKVLKQLLSAYGENTNNVNGQDIEYLCEGIEKQTIKSKNILANIQLVKYFGYHFSDAQFEQKAFMLLNSTKHCIKNKYATSVLIRPLLEAIEEIEYRFSAQQGLEFVYFIFGNGSKRYYDDALKYIYRLKRWDIDENEQLKCQEFLIKLMEDEDSKKNFYYLFPAAQTVRLLETIPHESLDRAVKKNNFNFYYNTYYLNVNRHDKKEGWEYTKKYIDYINHDNATQGKNGCYVGNAINPYRTISNIMLNNNIKYDTRQMRQLIYSIQGTLFSKTQTINAKIDAIELLCMLQLKHPKTRIIKNLVYEIEEHWHEIADIKDPFWEKGYSDDNLELNYVILKLEVMLGSEKEFISRFIRLQNSEIATQIEAFRMLSRLLEQNILRYWNDSEKNCFFQYVMNSSYNENYDLRFQAMSAMTKMLGSDYKQLCLERFVEMIDNEPYQNKVGMLYRLKPYYANDPKVKFIFEKGKSDSHYWVRRVASLEDA